MLFYFFGALAGTLSAAVLLSMVVSLVGIPAAAARFLRPRTERGQSAFERAYGRVADFGARYRSVGVVLVIAASAAGLHALGEVPSEFLPAMDEARLGSLRTAAFSVVKS